MKNFKDVDRSEYYFINMSYSERHALIHLWIIALHFCIMCIYVVMIFKRRKMMGEEGILGSEEESYRHSTKTCATQMRNETNCKQLKF